MTDEELKMILLEAVSTPYGLALVTNAPERFRQKFYKPMKELGITNLKLRIPPTPGELWLVLKNN